MDLRGTSERAQNPSPQPSSYVSENCLLFSAAPPDSIESAAAYIAAGSAAIRQASPSRSRYAAEFEALVSYAQESELILSAGAVPENPPDRGQEHVIWSSGDAKRVFKATHPNKFGFTVGEHPDASPLQYFERMSLTNRIFGDDIRFEGLHVVAGKVQVVISQPLIVGEVAQPLQVEAFMQRIGFQGAEVDGQLCWYLEEENVLAFDAHTRNFIATDAGPIPIDVNVVRLEGDFSAQLVTLDSNDGTLGKQ